MGTCQSTAIQDAQKRNRTIERSLRPDAKTLTQKLLLLGPGESGKSTILKQMIILHKNGFTQEEMNERKGIIFSNTITYMSTILQAMDTLDIPLADAQLEYYAKLILGVVESDKELEPLTEDVVTAIKHLWADTGVRRCYERRSEYQLHDSSKYFLDSVDRVSDMDYCPTEQDLLYTRSATTGVVEVAFVTKNIEFRVFDVGGQRSERRKWIHCFDDVNAVTFVAAVSEFDQQLREDDKTNRVQEALTLFDEICNNQYFANSSIVLFLNKTDLFREKIQKVSLKVSFPEYDGGLDYADGIQFLKLKFAGLKANADKTLYTHETCATDTQQVQNVIDSVIDTVIQKKLKEAGVMY